MMVGVTKQVFGGPAKVIGDGVVLSYPFKVDLNKNKLWVRDKKLKNT
jgi:hypothetical protein